MPFVGSSSRGTDAGVDIRISWHLVAGLPQSKIVGIPVFKPVWRCEGYDE